MNTTLAASQLAPATEKQPNEKLSQYLWTAFILMFFMIQAIVWSIAITLISNDKSHTVVEGYDELALKWDQSRMIERESAALGWKSGLTIAPQGDVMGSRELKLALTDANEQPVAGAKLQVKAFHRGRAAEVQMLVFQETEPGIYSSSVQVRHGGQWELSGVASQGGNLFLIDERPVLRESRD